MFKKKEGKVLQSLAKQLSSQLQEAVGGISHSMRLQPLWQDWIGNSKSKSTTVSLVNARKMKRHIQYLGEGRAPRLTDHPQPLWPKPCRWVGCHVFKPHCQEAGTQMNKKLDSFSIKYLAKIKLGRFCHFAENAESAQNILAWEIAPQTTDTLSKSLRQLAEETRRFTSIVHLLLKR